MRAQDQIAGEMHEEMLAARLDALDGAADERPVDVHSLELRQYGLKSDDRLTGERAMERARRAENGVAFGHELSASCCVLRAWCLVLGARSNPEPGARSP